MREALEWQMGTFPECWGLSLCPGLMGERNTEREVVFRFVPECVTELI